MKNDYGKPHTISRKLTAPLHRLVGLLRKKTPPSPPLSAPIQEKNMVYPYAQRIDRLISCTEEPYTGQHYAVCNGKKHWILSARFYQYGNIGTPEPCSARHTSEYPLAASISYCPNSFHDCADALEARAFLLKDYHGTGLEFGAANLPLPLPLDATVEYSDIFSQDEGANPLRGGVAFVSTAHHTSLDEMEGIPENTYDFIVSSHVIEHCRNPIRVLQAAHQKLKKGGRLFFTVPHMHYTFDKDRRLTSVAHMVEDFLHPDHERDAIHTMDFVVNVLFQEPERDQARIDAILKQYMQREEIDVHYHTFTEENFDDMIQWYAENIAPWSHYTIHPRTSRYASNEFFVELVK